MIRAKTTPKEFYLIMSEPGVCESEVDCTAVFLEFSEALDERLQGERERDGYQALQSRHA